MADPELDNLVLFLDKQREVLLRKCEGLSDDQLRIRLPSSSLTLAGLLKHGALNEDWWFSHRFAGHDELPPFSEIDFDVDPEWEFRTALEDTGDDLRALYRDACDRSRAVVAAASGPDALSALPRGDGEQSSLRWTIGHMIEETARHAGHADLLREAVDGSTGE
ncbi:DinB family protein [Jatrophihabitans sp. YIM 134969]